jgi:hypothetical protein
MYDYSREFTKALATVIVLAIVGWLSSKSRKREKDTATNDSQEKKKKEGREIELGARANDHRSGKRNCGQEGDAKVKKNLTRIKVALIAGAASLLTSAIYGFVKAITTPGSDFDNLEVLVYVVAFTVGSLPTALICFGLVYGILRAKGIDGMAATDDHA